MDATNGYQQPASKDGFQVWGRQNPDRFKGPHDAAPESPFEKQMIVADLDNTSTRDLVWADARFAVDIMSEHSLFFALLMPPEVALEERRQALQFQRKYQRLFQRIDRRGPPSEAQTRSFVRDLKDQIQPLIDYKEDNHKAQINGSLQSLVWPLFFDHTRREAVRWVDRMEQIVDGQARPDRKEVVTFWGGIMDEHARFIAHLLDPDEVDLVEKAFKTSEVFQALSSGTKGPMVAALKHPGAVAGSLRRNPELDAVESAVETVLDFKTDAVRKIEAAKIRSIISPVLADHVRREAVKFLDELKRSSED